MRAGALSKCVFVPGNAAALKSAHGVDATDVPEARERAHQIRNAFANQTQRIASVCLFRAIRKSQIVVCLSGFGRRAILTATRRASSSVKTFATSASAAVAPAVDVGQRLIVGRHARRPGIFSAPPGRRETALVGHHAPALAAGGNPCKPIRGTSRLLPCTIAAPGRERWPRLPNLKRESGS
jgi:hypothetical protein